MDSQATTQFSKDSQNPILTAPVRKGLITMAAPAAFGMLMTFLFQLVDTYFVGQLGTEPLAAMSYSYPIYILLISFFMGSAAGVSATVAKALGEGDHSKAKQLTALAITTFVVLTLLLSLLAFSFIEPIFIALGAKGNALVLVQQYMAPLLLGMFALVAGLIVNSALMAKGLMIKSTIVMGIGGLVNVVFDYLLIFGIGPFPELQLQGAALATVLSWLTILVLMSLLLIKESLISFAFVRNVGQSVQWIVEMMTIALPAIVAQLLNPVAIAVLTRTVAGYGDSSIAAFGIVTRIESLVLVGIFSLSVIITPYVAQNFGAQSKQRLDQVVANAGRLTVYWGVAMGIVMALFAESIMGIFTDSAEVIAQGKLYLYIVGLSFAPFGLTLITTSFFNGVQQPKQSLKLTLVKNIGLTIPLAVIAGQFSLIAIWAAIAIANVLGAVYAFKLLKDWQVENGSSLVNHSVLGDYISDVKGLKRQAQS